jgi:hypothetical protein
MATVERIKELLASNPVAIGFTPYHELNLDADALTIYFKPDADYSKRLNDHITLYLSIESQQIVGCRIKGIKGILDDLPNYIEVRQPKLSLVFLPFRGAAVDERERNAINELAQATRNMPLETMQ